MHPNIILLAETGSDIPAALAGARGIYLVPMHVSMGEKTLDDGSFPAQDVCAYYDRTGKVPTTSAAMPYDFEKVFDEIRARYPAHPIVHLAYSAVTTCSYQNALLAAQAHEGIFSVDTKHVSVGQHAVVMRVADLIEQNPALSAQEVCAAAEQIAKNTCMCFVPNNLDYLRAGGRVSNVAALAGNLLNLHPCIEVLDGKLMATKKYRGKLIKFLPKMIAEYTQKNNLDPAMLYFIRSPYLAPEIQQLAEATARDLGYPNFKWVDTGCVITCHGGPGAFGIVGFKK